MWNLPSEFIKSLQSLAPANASFQAAFEIQRPQHLAPLNSRPSPLSSQAVSQSLSVACSAMVVASVSATNLTVTKLSQQPLMNLELRSDLQPIPRLRRRNTSSESSSSSIHSSPSSIVVDIFRS
ncbi:hypothetical protein Bca4012_031893 [Brassica carinata]